MSARKHLPRLFAALAIAFVAATSFAPRAHAAAEIDEHARYELLADALERVVGMYEFNAGGNPVDQARVKAKIGVMRLHACYLYDELRYEVFSGDDPAGFTFSPFLVDYLEECLLIEEGSLVRGAHITDLEGFESSKEDFLDLYETVRCLQRFLSDEEVALERRASLADRAKYLKGAVSALRSGDSGRVDSFNELARRVQGAYAGTIEASGDDAAIDAAAPAILAGVAGIAVGVGGFAIVSRRRS